MIHNSRSIIGHLDMDAFFAAVEERDRPRLKGKPIVIGSDPLDGKGRGIVATANYKAREYGIFSATPISKAWELSEKAKSAGKPAVVFIGGSHKHYGKISESIMEAIRVHSSVVQQVGLDEAYFDLSDCKSYKNAIALAKKIKREIGRKEKLTCSVGIGPNKLIAKIASDMNKPNGLTVVEEKDVEKFLEPLPIRKIPGIGPKMEQSLVKLGVKTVLDLKKLSEDEMQKRFGKWGKSLYEKARGKGSTRLETNARRKSIGEERTFSADTLDLNKITETLNKLCVDVFRSFRNSEFEGFKTISIKVRLSDFSTKNRSKTFKGSVPNLKTFKFEALKMLLPFFDKRENPKRKAIRLIGVRIEKLESKTTISRLL